MSNHDPRTADILRKLTAKMSEMEQIVGDVRGLVAQLAEEEDSATLAAIERTRQAFHSVRSRVKVSANG